MIINAGMLLLTALLASVFTWVLAWLLFRLHFRKQLDQAITELQAEFETRVKNGVKTAAMELLPDFRQAVKLGFTDAMTASHAAGFVEDTAKMMSAGAGIVENGLSALLGIKPRR
ncbi:MAG: hypothetical protein ACRETW_11605 [Stenotrophobium sp.]